MDSILLTLFIIALIVSIILIVVTLVSLPPLGDERKNLIQMKVQSYTFAIVILYMIKEIYKKAYINIGLDGSYKGINPFTFLLTISIIYLISLLFFKKRYSG